MKIFATAFLFLMLVAPAALADNPLPMPAIAEQCGIIAQSDDLSGILEAARGCCSHHGGMSGQCSNGRVVCRDGSISPTCKCRADSEIPADKG